VRQHGPDWLPVTTDTLTESAAYGAYTKHSSAATIEHARWAIRKAHRAADQPVPDSMGLRLR
jgi:hypothetical protein